jgi:antitoxin ParD1/3/4
MSRQSISITEPNERWMNELLKAQEFASKSEIVNDLIRRARETEQLNEFIRKKLELAEQSGLSQMSASDIRAESYARLNR